MHRRHVQASVRPRLVGTQFCYCLTRDRHDRVLFGHSDRGILDVMGSRSCHAGHMRQFDQPDWAPLQRLLESDDLCDQFMWMNDVELDDGTIVNAYKHRSTRGYLYLSQDGRAFRYADDYRSQDARYSPDRV